MYCRGYLWGMYLGGVPARGGVPAWGRGVPDQGVCTCQGSVPARGVYLPGECTCQGVYLPGGCTCPEGGGYLPRYFPPVNRMTDRQVSKHNLRKLHLRAVMKEIGQRGQGRIPSDPLPQDPSMVRTKYNCEIVSGNDLNLITPTLPIFPQYVPTFLGLTF